MAPSASDGPPFTIVRSNIAESPFWTEDGPVMVIVRSTVCELAAEARQNIKNATKRFFLANKPTFISASPVQLLSKGYKRYTR